MTRNTMSLLFLLKETGFYVCLSSLFLSSLPDGRYCKRFTQLQSEYLIGFGDNSDVSFHPSPPTKSYSPYPFT